MRFENDGLCLLRHDVVLVAVRRYFRRPDDEEKLAG